MQTSPVGTFPRTLRGAVPIIWQAEGLNGFYKSLAPLWGRQIPYTMMKFACFERTVEALYMYVVPKPRSDCSKAEQLVVTFAAGYIAGGKLVKYLIIQDKYVVKFLQMLVNCYFSVFNQLCFSSFSFLCYCISSC